MVLAPAYVPSTLNSRSAATICARLKAAPAVCAVGVPEIPLAEIELASVKVCPGKIVKRRSAPTACDRAPKEVEPDVIPVIVAVPGLAVVRRIVPEDGRAPP